MVQGVCMDLNAEEEKRNPQERCSPAALSLHCCTEVGGQPGGWCSYLNGGESNKG